MNCKSFAVAMLAALSVAAADEIEPENPLNMPDYIQTVQLRFATAAQAEAARLEALPLPDGKAVAFSTRWDDNNPKHAVMAELLKKHGYKGTFFLCRTNADFDKKILPKLIAPGFSVAAHTLSHLNMTNVSPNRNFQEAMQNRIELESRTDTQVVAFALPGCAYRNIFHQTPRMIGEALERTGLLGSPEYYPDLEKEYGLPRHSWFTSYLFCPDDRNPSAELFDRGIQQGYEHLQKNIREPHITLGIHTWQDDAGFATLEKSLEQYAKNPSWWYCNENEYIAYRYNFAHSKVLAKKVIGNNAVFTIRRISPEQTGANLPLDFAVTPKPLEATPPAILRDGGRYISLAHAPDHDVPTKIDVLVNGSNQALKAGELVSKKISGLSAELFVDTAKQTIRLQLGNRSGKLLRNIRIAFRLPPVYAEGVEFRKLSELATDQSATFERKLGSLRTEPEYQNGPLYFAAQIDFRDDKEAGRIYATTLMEREEQIRPVPRDTVRLLGPLPIAILSDEELQKLSDPATVLRAFGESANANWQKTEVFPDALPTTVSLRIADAGWNSAAKTFQESKEPGRFVAAFDFISPQEGYTRLYCNVRNAADQIFLNGEEYKHQERLQDISVRKGVNRILFAIPAELPRRMMNMSVCTGENPHDCFEFIDPLSPRTSPEKPPAPKPPEAAKAVPPAPPVKAARPRNATHPKLKMPTEKQ